MSLHWWDQTSSLALNSACVPALQTPTALQSCWNIVPPKPQFSLLEDGGNFLLLLFYSVSRMKIDEVIGVYTGRFGLHFLFTRTALVMNNGASNYSLQAIYSWDLALFAV